MVADETRISIEANPYYVWNIKGKTPIKKQKLEIHKGRTIFGALSMRMGKIIQYTSQHKKALAAVQLLEQIKWFKENWPIVLLIFLILFLIIITTRPH